MHKLINIIKIFIAIVVGYALTTFLFLNSYEILAKTDLPFVEAVSKMSLIEVLNTNETSITNYEGLYGIPVLLRIPSQNLKTEIVSEVKSNIGENLCYVGKVHYKPISNNKDGLLGDTIFYIRNSWRTITFTDQLQVGDNIFVDTKKDWRYMYKISKKTAVNIDSMYVLPESKTGKIILLIEDTKSQTGYIYEMDYISLQIIQ